MNQSTTVTVESSWDSSFSLGDGYAPKYFFQLAVYTTMRSTFLGYWEQAPGISPIACLFLRSIVPGPGDTRTDWNWNWRQGDPLEGGVALGWGASTSADLILASCFRSPDLLRL